MPMPEPITLRSPAVCADCGAELPAGSKARWYSKSQRAYCAGPHTGPRQPPEEGPPPGWDDEPEGQETPPGPREEGADQFGDFRREKALEQSVLFYQGRMDTRVDTVLEVAERFEKYLREG